jgi:hypothetical protein
MKDWLALSDVGEFKKSQGGWPIPDLFLVGLEGPMGVQQTERSAICHQGVLISICQMKTVLKLLVNWGTDENSLKNQTVIAQQPVICGLSSASCITS